MYICTYIFAYTHPSVDLSANLFIYPPPGLYIYLVRYLAVRLSFQPTHILAYLPMYIPINVYTYRSAHPCVHLTIYISTDVSVYPLMHISSYLSIDMSTYRSIYIYISTLLSIYTSTYLNHLSICLYIHASIHICICLDPSIHRPIDLPTST